MKRFVKVTISWVLFVPKSLRCRNPRHVLPNNAQEFKSSLISTKLKATVGVVL